LKLSKRQRELHTESLNLNQDSLTDWMTAVMLIDSIKTKICDQTGWFLWTIGSYEQII